MAIDILFVIALVTLIIVSIGIANRLKVAYPVVLVLVGLCLGFLPGAPSVRLDPELIFVIFLPPLLYESPFQLSWRELWRFRRVISSFAFLVVFFSATTVAFLLNLLIPGLGLAMGFVIGSIVSPPDAVSASAIKKFVTIPEAMSIVLEGEGLFNDASSLIILRFAIIAVTTGQFVLFEAIGSFIWMVIGGVAIGVAIAYVFVRIHRRFVDDANMNALFTLIAPYLMYILAEQAKASGVLAVVCGGIFVSSRLYTTIRRHESRIRATNIWESLVYLLNGLVFMLIGLDLPEILADMEREHISLGQGVFYGLIVTIALIVVRYISAFIAFGMSMLLARFVTIPAKPRLSGVLLIGWTGMRGIVTLAAALALPLTLPDGSPFPYRALTLFIAFVVILFTLLVQGLTLPYLVRRLVKEDAFLEAQARAKESRELILQGLRDVTWDYFMEHADEVDHRNRSYQYFSGDWMRSNKESLGNPLTKEERELYARILQLHREWLLCAESRLGKDLDYATWTRAMRFIDSEEQRIENLI